MQISILLSDLRAFILNVILEGEQSFKLTSTASQLKFAHLSLFHGPPPLPPPFARNLTSLPSHEPLPSIEGRGLVQYCPCSLRSEDAAAAAPPLSKGMWVAWTCLREEWRGERHEGGHRRWKAQWVRLKNRLQHLS